MRTFVELLIEEGRRELVPPEVLAGYERGFKQALVQLLGRVQDPVLRAKFQAMLDCPIRDARGRCSSFTGYILGALVRHGVHRQADLEDVLSYIYSMMMLPQKDNGEPRATIFGGFDADRNPASEGNPLEARFRVAVGNAVRNIASGRIPRLLNTGGRPQGTMSIGQGRGDPGTVSHDEIRGRPDNQAGVGELIGDINVLLQLKEAAYGLPLVALFNAMMAGQRMAEQRKRFGDLVARTGRQIIIQTIKDYATSSGNHYLLQLLQRLKEPEVQLARPVKAPPVARPVFSTPQTKDYASILSVVDRMGRPVGTADLGRYRRRWLEYAPRDPASGHPNRMTEVLGQMVRDGVLQTVQTGRGAIAYLPGPNAARYRQPEAI